MRAPVRPRSVLKLLAIPAAFLALLAACGVGLEPLPGDQGSVQVEVHSELGQGLGQSSRFRVAGRRIDAGALWVLRGDLSSYAIGQIRRSDASQALLDRRVPSLNWLDATDGDMVVAPLEALTGVISLVEVGGEILFQGTVEPSREMLRRVWPPVGHVAAKQALFCFDGASTLDSSPLEDVAELVPTRESVELKVGMPLGLEASRCVRLTRPKSSLEEAPTPSVSPLSFRGFGLDPTLFDASSSGPPAPSVPRCVPPAVQLPLGCATVMDDRIVLSFSESVLAAVKVGARAQVQALGAAESLNVLGLEPETPYALSVVVVDLRGAERTIELQLTTLPALPRVVLNEVLANPRGPEPKQEWVELYNDGRAPANLSGFTLEDNGGATILPDVVLPSGGYALLVNEAFDAALGSDVVPNADTLLIRVSRLGTNGLANSGETLRLRDGAGTLVSSFSADPPPLAGVSLARKEPANDAPDAFAVHQAPGASPGAPNLTEPAPE